MIYIDQPIGTGFSYGTDTVNSTEAAAPFVWTAFQILFESGEFSKFQSRECVTRPIVLSFFEHSSQVHFRYRKLRWALWPEFRHIFRSAKYTHRPEKTGRRESGRERDDDQQVGFSVLLDAAVNIFDFCVTNNFHSGWYDPLLQNEAYVTFATNAPGYGPLQSPKVLAQINQSFFETGGCKDQELDCYAAAAADAAGQNGPGNSTLSDKICLKADNFCVSLTTIVYPVSALSCNISSRSIRYSPLQWVTVMRMT